MADVEFEASAGVGWVSFRNEEKRNALTLGMKDEMIEILRRVGEKDDIAVVVLESAGTDAFCSGGDLQEIPDHDFRLERFFNSWEQLFETMRTVEKPIVAKVDGWTLGGGFDMMLNTDIVIAADDAMMGQPEIGVGVMNPFSAALLPELVGLRKAMELMLTGKPISGREAESIGLVTRSVPDEALNEQVQRTVDALCQYSPRVLALVKEGMYDTIEMTPTAAYHHLKDRSLKKANSDPDYMTGVTAQLEGREPDWSEDSL